VNTPAHMILAMAAFGRRDAGRVTAAAALGGLAPDLPLFAMVGWSLGISGVSATHVFDVLYFSPPWQRVFSVDHALALWAGILALAAVARAPAALAFSGAGLLHAVADFLVHNEDARPQLWPFTDRVFRSPVSYWDPAHYGNIYAPAEAAVSLGLCAYLWVRHRSGVMRASLAALGTVEVVLVFGGHAIMAIM